MTVTGTGTDLRTIVDDRAARRAVAASDLAGLFLERVVERERALHAVVTATPELALACADDVDRARRAGEPLPLDGMPVVLKDNIDVAGVRGACGSKFFLDRVADDDAYVVRLLRDAGAIILGKSHTTEFMFALAAHPSLPACRNAWDPDRIPGASSSGSGAALADDQTVGALGTDTGGSVRIPASFSGVTGLRPTHGVIGNSGVFPLARSLDTVGPMARAAVDVADLFAVLARLDPADTRAVPYRPEQSLAANGRSTLRIGVPRQFFFDDCEPDIERCVLDAIDEFVRLGHTVVPVDLPLAQTAQEGFTLLIRAEALTVHAERLRERPDDFSVDVRDRLRLGEELTGRDVALLIEDMHAWKRELAEMFSSRADVVMTPTTQCSPPRVEEARLGRLPNVTRLTYPWSFGGVPAISVPCGFTRDRLPVGLQVAGPWHSEWRLLDLARAYQSITGWHRDRPSVPPLDRGKPATKEAHAPK
jgi:aspartyl-tRNA(Asn)/glutamyl-tRNA(Gln) amidotransferase subunit A